MGAKKAIFVSFAALALSLTVVGPSRLFPPLAEAPVEMKLKLAGIGLFITGLASAFL